MNETCFRKYVGGVLLKGDLKMKSFRFDWTALMCAQQIQSWIGTGIRYKAVEDMMREK